MDHYFDIHVLPDPDLSVNAVASGVYAHLHKMLAKSGRHDVGVSFPRVDKGGLGAVLRLHGTLEALQAMAPESWLYGAKDHVRWGEPARVPEDVRHCAVRRVQAKSSPERLRRRQIKRHGLSEAEARARIPDEAAAKLVDPYLRLSSGSTGQHFLLFIRHGEPSSEAVQGVFNSYGLSRTATVPWF